MRAVDLFCGGGGSSAGARAAGFKMVGAVDGWDTATAIYSENFPDAKVVTARLNNRTDPDIFGNIGKVDLLIASPECTNHSIARGNRPRDEQSRSSGWFVMKFVREFSPRWIVLENVPQMRNWPGFESYISALRRSYHIDIKVLDAADFGVPQNRRRLFIVGDRVRPPKIVSSTCSQWRPAATILDRKGAYPTGPLYTEKRAEGTLERAERGIEALGAKKNFLVVYYGSDRAGGWQPLDRPLRTLTTLDRFGLIEWRGRKPMLRMLQVSELMRAMGLKRLKDGQGEPIKFTMNHGSRRDKIKILGNGVCPPVMKSIAGSLAGGMFCDLILAAE